MFLLLVSMGCKSHKAQNDVRPDEVQDEVTVLPSPKSESKSYFFATVTEPFWSVDLSEEVIIFKTPSDTVIFQHTNPMVAQDSNVKRYDVATESSKMGIQIMQAECTNAMSGKVSPYKVSINYKKGRLSEIQNLEGCGDYKTDYRLHDRWVLESLNGKTMTKDDFSREFPYMEINAADNRFSGFAGCNRMNGVLFFEKGLLRFTKVATTRMVCGPSNKEAEFLKALQRSTTYSIGNNRLTLSNPSGILTVFKKMD